MFPKKYEEHEAKQKKTYKRAAKNTEVLNEFERIESKKFLPLLHINIKLNYGK